MFKSTKDFEAAIKEILVAARDEKSLTPEGTEFQSDDYFEAVTECIDRRLLSGISYDRTVDGTPHFTPRKTRVTYSGLAFIESH